MSENPIFSYTNRDYESSRKEGISRIPLLSKGAWTDLNATDPGIIILDYVHALVDMINFYQDHQALETFLPTAKERESIFRLAEQLSYKVVSAKGAICSVTFSSPFTYDHPIKIPKHTRLKTANDIYYITSEDTYLPKGESEVSVPCEQGMMKEISYVGTGISRFSNNGNATNQAVQLTDSNIDSDSILIVDNLGREWGAVDYITFSSSTDRVYQARLNPNDSITILFGDGERGLIPKETDTLSIKYKVTNAEDGNVSANSLIYLEDILYDGDQVIELTVTNPEASVGGSSVQTSREIRELAPGAIKSQYRAVTLKDFESLAKLVSGVKEAKAYDMNTNEILLHHEVLVLIIPESEGSETSLKNEVYSFLYNRMIPPTNLKVMTPSRVIVNMTISVKKVDYATSEEVEYEVREVVNEYFEERSGEVGEDLYLSNLSSRIDRLNKVRYVISMEPSNVVSIPDFSTAKLGTLTVTVS